MSVREFGAGFERRFRERICLGILYWVHNLLTLNQKRQRYTGKSGELLTLLAAGL